MIFSEKTFVMFAKLKINSTYFLLRLPQQYVQVVRHRSLPYSGLPLWSSPCGPQSHTACWSRPSSHASPRDWQRPWPPSSSSPIRTDFWPATACSNWWLTGTLITDNVHKLVGTFFCFFLCEVNVYIKCNLVNSSPTYIQRLKRQPSKVWAHSRKEAFSLRYLYLQLICRVQTNLVWTSIHLRMWYAYTTAVCFRLHSTDTCTRCLRFLSLFLSSVKWSKVFQNIVNLKCLLYFIHSLSRL